MTQGGGASRERRVAWEPDTYDAQFAFVWKYGVDLVSLLAPQKGERILDLGCGTGHITAKIAETGATVLGVDRSPQMIEAARRRYPHLQFEVVDARDLHFRAEFDAVFSNATLHWILEPELVIRAVRNALRSGGRFVAEFGGRGNTRKIQSALEQVAAEFGLARPGEINPFYYPSASDYAGLLENNGLEVRYMTLVDRPTPMGSGHQGIRNWIAMFGPDYCAKLDPANRELFYRKVEAVLRPELFHDDQWWGDYRRLRFSAYK